MGPFPPALRASLHPRPVNRGIPGSRHVVRPFQPLPESPRAGDTCRQQLEEANLIVLNKIDVTAVDYDVYAEGEAAPQEVGPGDVL